MEINDERTSGKKRFEELVPGDVFEFEPSGVILMKIAEVEIESFTFNAIYLSDGDLEFFDQEDMVTPLVVQLRILRND